MSARLAVGTRMVAQAARIAFLDNAEGFTRLAEACDLSRPTQSRRHQDLVSLQAQQEAKAALLQARLRDDALVRCTRVTGDRVESRYSASPRYRKDKESGKMGRVVAANKERERRRAAEHQKILAAEAAAVRVYEADGDEAATTLTLQVHEATAFLNVAFISAAGALVVEFSAPSMSSVRSVKGRLAYKLKSKFRLVTGSGTHLSSLWDRVLAKDVMTIDSGPLGLQELADEEKILPLVRSRNLRRKPPSSNQRRRKWRNRKLSIRRRRQLRRIEADAGEAVDPLMTPTVLMPLRCKAPPPTPPSRLRAYSRPIGARPAVPIGAPPPKSWRTC